MIFRQLFDPVSSTYTYLLADPVTREALAAWAERQPMHHRMGSYTRR